MKDKDKENILFELRVRDEISFFDNVEDFLIAATIEMQGEDDLIVTAGAVSYKEDEFERMWIDYADHDDLNSQMNNMLFTIGYEAFGDFLDTLDELN